MAEFHDLNHRKKRGHTPKSKSKENLAKMEEIRNRLKMTKADFSIALGYVTSGGYDASTIRRGEASLTLLLAAEGVERRYAGKDAKGPLTYTLLAVHPNGKVDSIPISGDPQTATIMGHDYILIPKKTV